MTNPLKGEVNLSLGGKDYKARLTIDAIMQVEQSVGCGILKLAQRMADADVRVTDIIAVLTPALRGGGNNVQPKDVTKIVESAGLVDSTQAVATLLTQSISPQEDSMEESAGEADEES
jgi:hypothetical protein